MALLAKPIRSITDAVSNSQAALGGWVTPIDVVTSKFKQTQNTIRAIVPNMALMKNEVRSISDAVSHSQSRLKGWINPMTLVQTKFSSVNKQVVTMDSLLKKTVVSMNKLKKAATGMNKGMLGLGLGLTFFLFGVKMQLDRMLRSMFNVFKEAQGETGILIQQFNIMKASLAAISIAFFDAFAQSRLFDLILNFVIGAADFFLNLSDSTREWLSTSLIVLH